MKWGKQVRDKQRSVPEVEEVEDEEGLGMITMLLSARFALFSSYRQMDQWTYGHTLL